jgi:hypothetical protein
MANPFSNLWTWNSTTTANKKNALAVTNVCNDLTSREVTETSEAEATTTCYHKSSHSEQLHGGEELLMEMRKARDKLLHRDKKLKTEIASEKELLAVGQMMGGYSDDDTAECWKKMKLCQRKCDKLHYAVALLKLYILNIESDLQDHHQEGECNDTGYRHPEDTYNCSTTLDFRVYESYSEEVDAILRSEK